VLAGSPDAVAALVAAGADAGKADSFEQTPLHLLASIDPPRAAIIAPLLRGADPRRPDARGFGALHAAAAADNALAIRGLLASADAGALEGKTFSLETPLDIALRYGRDRAAEALLQAGAALRPEAWPPLHEAARTDAVERAALLVASGADTARRVRGKTALELARESGSDRVASLLHEPER
jgi:ankyrin repeat protein